MTFSTYKIECQIRNIEYRVFKVKRTNECIFKENLITPNHFPQIFTDSKINIL